MGFRLSLAERGGSSQLAHAKIPKKSVKQVINNPLVIVRIVFIGGLCIGFAHTYGADLNLDC